MKSSLRASVVALLLLAVFSCQKDASTNAPANGSSADRTSASLTTDLAPASDLVAPVGDWIYYYSWGCTGIYNATTISIYANGTWSSGEGYTGQWFDGRGVFSLIYDAPSRTTYSGNERVQKIAGISNTYNGLEGCFYLAKAPGGTFKTTHASGTPDAAGKLTQGN